MTITIDAQARTMPWRKMKKADAAGYIPAVVYGRTHEPRMLMLDEIAFNKVYKTAGESTIVSLGTNGKAVDTVIHSIGRDTMTGKINHVDFYAVEATREMHVAVPLVFSGEPAGIKLGGVLTKVMHELEVSCIPANLPHEITVDLTPLDQLGSQIHVRDIALPKGVRATADADEVVAILAAAVEEPVEEKVEEVAVPAVESAPVA